MRVSLLQSYYINYLEFFCMGDESISAQSFIYSIIYIIWTQEFLNILCYFFLFKTVLLKYFGYTKITTDV